MRASDWKFGRQMGPDGASAPEFIQHVAKDLTNGGGSAGGQSFDDPNVLSPAEDAVKALYPADRRTTDITVFNFALARVRYIGLIGANDVRVFFRLFQAQTTSGVYDFPPGSRYRRAASNPDGQPIPLAGIQGNEYVTLPFFALAESTRPLKNMDQQTDSQCSAARSSGTSSTSRRKQTAARSTRSSAAGSTSTSRHERHPCDSATPSTPTGRSRASRILRCRSSRRSCANLHQCLIAEVAFDPVAIPPGKDPSNWDKLAQRNIAWSDVGSATAVDDLRDPRRRPPGSTSASGRTS